MRAWIYCRECNVGSDGECDPDGVVLGEDTCPNCDNKLRAAPPQSATSDDDRYFLTDKGLAAIGRVTA